MGWYHKMLCCKGARWLQDYESWNHRTFTPGYDSKWSYILVEPYLGLKERPDIFAFNGYVTLCIEVKTNYDDFKNDKKKLCRHEDYKDKIGMFKSFLAPKGIIPVKELPEGWGLLEWDEYYDTIEVIIPCFKKSNPTNGDLYAIGSFMNQEKVEKGIYSRKPESQQNGTIKYRSYEGVLKIVVGKINRTLNEKRDFNHKTGTSMRDILKEVQRRYMRPLS